MSETHADYGDDSAPRIEALFVVRFDKKIGYTIAWKRTTGDIELDKAVEYKSLPSGLHSVQRDLVYFTHEGYAGISAFARGEASAQERNANFVAVGILVRREGAYGRLGRGWMLAGRLEKLAAALVDDETLLTPLDDFWHSRARAISTVSDDHPALSMLQYMDVFGPLVFRLQQAALLRKRILFVGMPPVRRMCEFVYHLSVLSTISPRDSELLIPGTESLLRLPTLFSIGVHDIASLEGNEAAEGWAACTTDEIITTKPHLYDIVVELPPTCHAPPEQRRWPRMRTSDGSLIKASQRDVARYRLLHIELFRHKNDDDDDDDYNQAYPDSVVEPMTWSRLAYLGFMWWASAGERDAYTTAERDMDRELIGDMAEYSQSVETAVMAYFHRQSSLLIHTLSQLIEADAESDEGEPLIIHRTDLSRLGLDTWSEADGAFVDDFGTLFFGRSVEVRGNEVDCCGLRVPVL